MKKIKYVIAASLTVLAECSCKTDNSDYGLELMRTMHYKTNSSINRFEDCVLCKDEVKDEKMFAPKKLELSTEAL